MKELLTKHERIIKTTNQTMQKGLVAPFAAARGDPGHQMGDKDPARAAENAATNPFCMI